MTKWILALLVLAPSLALADDECLVKAALEPQAVRCAQLQAQHPSSRLRCEVLIQGLAQPCVDAAFFKAQADARAAAIQAAADAEAKCQASAACISERARSIACGMVLSRAGIAQQIARERANPAHVVNLTMLHSLGQALQSLDEQIPAAKAQYTAIAHKALVCS
jgi:hypothetical protein